MNIAEEPPPGVCMRIVTPQDGVGARFEMGVGEYGDSWFGYARVRADSIQDAVTLSLDSLSRMRDALRDDSVGDLGRGDPIVQVAGVDGGSLVVRAMARYAVEVTVTTPAGSAKTASYLRDGVAHMADALLQRTTE